MSTAGYKKKDENLLHMGISYPISPTLEQKEIFEAHFNGTRFFWNKMNEEYEATGVVRDNPKHFRDKYPWLKELDSMSLYATRDRFKAAVQKYEKVKKSIEAKIAASPSMTDGEKERLLAVVERFKPKYKSKKRDRNRKRSYGTVCTTNNIRLLDGTIKLPKVKEGVKANVHRLPPADAKILMATIVEEATGNWHISLNFSYPKPGETILVSRRILERIQDGSVTHLGLDFTMDGLYVDSEGNSAGMPRFSEKSEKSRRKAQRRLHRKKKGSKGYETQRKKLAKIDAKTKNRREDWLKKRASSLSSRYEVISVEDLDMTSYSRRSRTGRRRFGRSVAENGFGKFRTYLEQQQEKRGHHLVRVNKFFPSSQLCHACGYKNPTVKDLGIREVVCPECGTVYDRDANAARNIDAEGLRILQPVTDRHGTGRIRDKDRRTPVDSCVSRGNYPVTSHRVKLEAPTSDPETP